MQFSKATIYLKGRNTPVVVEAFSELMVNSETRFIKLIPEKLTISSNAYIFIGKNNTFSINGEEIQAVYFE